MKDDPCGRTSGASASRQAAAPGTAPEQVCRQGIGLALKDRRVFLGVTVEENLRLGLLQTPRRTRAEARARLEGIYERFSRLAERRRQMGTTLSGGQQQMLSWHACWPGPLSCC